jgi:hypothetical protein
MNASKEQARKALAVLESIDSGLCRGEDSHGFQSEVQQLRTFLEAAWRKLPSEAASKRAKAKRK